ncbi:MAG: fimbrillin family protein [Bacteroidales bacterium]|nr:fimbrillin family protein [Bacteroidales bacterium]
MKKILFAAVAAAVVALPSCSSDETVDLNKGNEVNFSVTAGKSSRAQATTTASISEFKTYAVASENDGAFFMNGVEVKKQGDAWAYSPTKFWPNGGTVNFLSISPCTPQSGTVAASAEAGGSLKLNDYTVAAAADEDLLYAANYGESKANPQVKVNFRHALSQIFFQVANTNSTLNIKVNDVKIVNLANKASLTWATQSTNDPNYSETENGGQGDGKHETELTGTWGVWSTPEGNTQYTAVGSLVELNGETQATAYTTDGGLMVMPQAITPWDFTSTEAESCGAYILINCQVVDETGAQLWPAKNVEGGFAQVAIPLTAPDGKWMQGKKYIYTLKFGNGAGWTPGTDPEPVLVPVEFTVTVDEFQTQDPIDVDMNQKK